MAYNDKNYEDFFDSYSPEHIKEADRQRSKRSAEAKKRKNQFKLAKVLSAVIAFVLIIVIISIGAARCGSGKDNGGDRPFTSITNTGEHLPTGAGSNYAFVTDDTVTVGGSIESSNAVLIDISNNVVLAQKKPNDKIYPASMTKVMTLLVASENVDDISATFKMTSEIIDPLYKDGASLAGFGPGETVTVKDMFYGAILESGAEATVGLAVYISGSEKEFVKLMNKKAAELGLASTNFCNVSGLHDKNHYTTCSDMAVIMAEAVKNDFCREVLTTEYYTVAANEFHEELKFHSTMLSRMYGTEPEVATILGGKTGYTANSGNCLASYGVTDDGRSIVCITADAAGRYKPIYDSIELFKNYTHPENGSEK